MFVLYFDRQTTQLVALTAAAAEIGRKEKRLLEIGAS